MSYTTVASVSDGQILSAAWLNSLRDNANYLGGIGTASISGFREVWTSDGGGTSWNIRHCHRYLKLLYSSNGDGGEVDYIRVYFNGTQVYNDGSPNTVSWHTVVIDLNDTGIITPTPTIGNNYAIRVDHAFRTDGWLSIHWFGEQSDSASL